MASAVAVFNQRPDADMLRCGCWAVVLVGWALVRGTAASHMVEFILSNRHVRDLNYDANATRWLEQFHLACNTSFVVHGWGASAHKDYVARLADEYLAIPGECFNAVRVNWPDALSANYAAAASAVRNVAEEAASFIRRLQRSGMVRSVELVGFSLGAHLAGLIGRTLSEYYGQSDLVSEIIGLDPAGPGFTDFFTTYQRDCLRPTDAKLVVMLMTNAACCGSSLRLGSVNFVANNGRNQIGCAQSDCVCSHVKAVEYFKESLTSASFVGRSEDGQRSAIFGRRRNDQTPPGDYAFRTNLDSPYGVA